MPRIRTRLSLSGAGYCSPATGRLQIARSGVAPQTWGQTADAQIMEMKYTVPTFSSDANTRPPTPPPEAPPASHSRSRGRSKRSAANPPQSDEQTFGELSQREQLYRIRPHLQRIIDDQYPPSIPRLDLFYAGQYDAVRKLAKYGDIRENEAINVFGAELRRWALRAERWGSENKPSVRTSPHLSRCLTDGRASTTKLLDLPALRDTKSSHRNNARFSSLMYSSLKPLRRFASCLTIWLRRIPTSRTRTMLRSRS